MIIRNLLILIEILLAYLFQASVFPNFQMAGIVPDCLIILIVAVAYMRGQIPGTVAGFISGLLIDMTYGSTVIGLFALFYATIGFFCGFANRIYDSEDYTLPYILIGSAEFVYNMFYYIFFILMDGKLNLWWYMVKYMFPKVIYTVFISIVVYRLYNLQHTYFEKRKHKTKKEKKQSEEPVNSINGKI